ncbi:hypothetical protein A1O1_08992 [Capronia coronata CBS 617.96]|uniref:Uncharacterized protein n=1 Tax=Capronia coronata CBS 617.96 TaxID=1182541 RepID=W9XNQ2_9EURO|nr:uncharacterized protein A1O1_08992 [Capronia coronata CBS 617.96]EXJ78591.1 hypothetical protein A1O1_08992 [Capronia coronata CBS 617.96]
MARNMDAHSSFVFLLENLPTWKASIQSLSSHADQKHTEFVTEYARLVNQIKPKRRRSPSMTSVHTTDDNDYPGQPEGDSTPSIDTMPPPLSRIEINPLEAGNKYLYAQARRRRRPGTSIRSGASGPQKFRNKNQVVVYYDAFLQEQLETMVKTIGVGRNNLRKGKNALVAAKGFSLPALSSTTRNHRAYPSLDSIRGTTSVSRSTPALVSGKKPTSHTVQPQAASDDETSFFLVDKELESIQSLCETAAHQFLRDGDCKTELDSICQRFDAVLAQATAVAESLKNSRQENQQELDGDREHADNTHSCGDSVGTLSTQPSLDVLHTPKIGAAMDRSHLIISHTLEDMKSRGAFFSAPMVSGDNAGMMTDNIEVDDASDQSSVVVDITQFRMTNPRRTRV